MKLTKTILTAAIALAAVSAAQAGPTINITGATSVRKAIHNGIIAAMGGSTVCTYAANNADVTKAGRAIFKGTVNGVPDVTVRTSFTGSVEGIRDLATGAEQDFIPTTASVAVGGVGAVNTTEKGTANAAFSDVFQTSTIYTSPALIDTKVAVIPFVFVGSNSLPAGVDSMTPQMFRAIWGSASPASMFMSSADPTGTVIYAVGRDNWSGTRLTALAETGWGVANPVNQYLPVFDGSELVDLALTPQVGTPGSAGYIAEGNNGQGAAVVAGFMGCNTVGYAFVSYLGLADSDTAVTAGGRLLKYNGVDFSEANVKSGKYNFWCYEHFFKKSNFATTPGEDKTVVDKLVQEISAPANLVSVRGIAPSQMAVHRDYDGGTILSNQ